MRFILESLANYDLKERLNIGDLGRGECLLDSLYYRNVRFDIVVRHLGRASFVSTHRNRLHASRKEESWPWCPTVITESTSLLGAGPGSADAHSTCLWFYLSLPPY